MSTAEGQTPTREPLELTPHQLNEDVYGDVDNLGQDFLLSIEKHGVLEPVVITSYSHVMDEEDVIISGHRRVVGAKEVGVEVPVRERDFADEWEEREALVFFNKHRTKTFSQKMREAELLEDVEEQRAKDRQGMRTDLLQNFARSEVDEDAVPRRERIAEAAGIGSGETYRKAKKVWEEAKGSGDLADLVQQEIERIDAGDQSIHGAFKKWGRWSEDTDEPDVDPEELDGPTQVGWDEVESVADSAGVSASWSRVEHTFEDAGDDIDDSEDWREQLHTVREAHDGDSSFGEDATFLYLLENSDYLDLSKDGVSRSIPDSILDAKPTAAELDDMLNQEAMSVREVALALGVPLELVVFWMREEGIPIRFNWLPEELQDEIKLERWQESNGGQEQ